MCARRQDINHLYMLFSQVIGLWFSLRNSRSFGMRKVFPSENNLETSLKLSTTPLCRVLARFYQRLVILSGPGALQWRFLDRTLTASATSRAHSSCDEAAFLFPDPLFSHKPARLFNVFKHWRIISGTFSRIFISWWLILWVPLQHLTQFRKHFSRDRVKLLVNRTRDLLLLLLLFIIIIIIIIIFISIIIIVITSYYISLRRLQSEYL